MVTFGQAPYFNVDLGGTVAQFLGKGRHTMGTLVVLQHSNSVKGTAKSRLGKDSKRQESKFHDIWYVKETKVEKRGKVRKKKKVWLYKLF
jgi:hypothetical protein